MTFSACPIGTVAASREHIWGLLMSPETYSAWWDAHTERIEPEGSATPGQVIYASARALGRNWPVTTRVIAIHTERRALDLETTLPLGIVVHNHIVCDAVDATTTRLTFG